MSSDKELLELAAKAAGIKVTFAPDGLCRDVTGFTPSMNVFAARAWNPLTDDGDALRLAVKLGIALTIDTRNRCVIADMEEVFYDDAKFGGDSDPYAATRRAIVRAAAEVGRNMK